MEASERATRLVKEAAYAGSVDGNADNEEGRALLDYIATLEGTVVDLAGTAKAAANAMELTGMRATAEKVRGHLDNPTVQQLLDP